MYKAVIIDDEARIVEGLRKLIPWEENNTMVVATANNVKEGLAIIEKHDPQILFTDIRMPDGTGLSMLAGLRSEHPDMQVTILTGHRDFEYARQAIGLGVTRFLLKPSKMAELVEALQAMTAALDKSAADSAQRSDKGGGKDDEEYVNSFVVREAIEYIQENHYKKLSLTDVADVCFVSQWHLSKLLSKYANQNFYDVLNTARIKEAKNLLKDPSLRIWEISDKVGYTDTPHFSRVFKKLEGMSPNEYRNAKT